MMMGMDVLVVSLLKTTLLMVSFRESLALDGNITRGPSYEHPARTSDLMCYICNNNVKVKAKNDPCVNMANSTTVLRCRKEQTFCKVRRLMTNGNLTTLDRKCDEYCEPGCNAGILNEECISCCQTSMCNTDNGAGGVVFSSKDSLRRWLIHLAPSVSLSSLSLLLSAWSGSYYYL